MKKTFLLPAFALLAGFNLTAFAEDREWISYKKFVESFYLDKFYATDPHARDHLRLLIRLQPADKAVNPADIILTVAHGGTRDRLPVDADGFMDVVPNPVWLKDDAMIYTNLPKGSKVQIDAMFAARTPDKLELSYADLMTACRSGMR